MIRTVIFGNAGSGKSTLARRYATIRKVRHLDLDDIAWKAADVREALDVSIGKLRSFMAMNEEWVIEGCYGSLIREATGHAHEVLFLNPGMAACQENCRSRPWEPHKYKSKKAQDENLQMLVDWVAEYESREDEFSRSAHKAIFESFAGKKRELRSNAEAQRLAAEVTADGQGR